ncbi:MAG: zinc ribbon domain-containing protein [Candidatus Omnitrophica bacterium]|nr:zinc ribbon domain-containing protein [Candidatus Omnitrophota bacterium]
MPTYEYQCSSCRHRFERFQPITAKSTSRCPRCKGRAKRLISSGAGLLFKGSGFYITDYRSSDYKKKAASESKPSGSAGAKKSEQKS